jgi:hypothetical protein
MVTSISDELAVSFFRIEGHLLSVVSGLLQHHVPEDCSLNSNVNVTVFFAK